MYIIKTATRFKQSLKRNIKDGYDLKLIEYVVDILSSGKSLPNKYRNHALKGVYKGYFDCHILPDLVLIYKIENDELLLFDIGTHSDLF